MSCLAQRATFVRRPSRLLTLLKPLLGDAAISCYTQLYAKMNLRWKEQDAPLGPVRLGAISLITMFTKVKFESTLVSASEYSAYDNWEELAQADVRRKLASTSGASSIASVRRSVIVWALWPLLPLTSRLLR